MYKDTSKLSALEGDRQGSSIFPKILADFRRNLPKRHNEGLYFDGKLGILVEDRQALSCISCILHSNGRAKLHNMIESALDTVNPALRSLVCKLLGRKSRRAIYRSTAF